MSVGILTVSPVGLATIAAAEALGDGLGTDPSWLVGGAGEA
jgi:hypothetical protein